MSDMNSPANLADEAWSNGDTDYHRRGKVALNPERSKRYEAEREERRRRRQERWDQDKRLNGALAQIERCFGKKHG